MKECRANDKNRQALGKVWKIQKRQEGIGRERKERFGHGLSLSNKRNGIRNLFENRGVNPAQRGLKPPRERNLAIRGGRRRGGGKREGKGDEF